MELQPFDTSHMAQTAEDRYAHAYGADLASIAAPTPAAASANDAAAVSSVMLRPADASAVCETPRRFRHLKKEKKAAYYVRPLGKAPICKRKTSFGQTTAASLLLTRESKLAKGTLLSADCIYRMFLTHRKPHGIISKEVCCNVVHNRYRLNQ